MVVKPGAANVGAYFRIVGEIENPETIAAGISLRVRERLRRLYGGRHWRKGLAAVELASGEIRSAEIHWYEAFGVGRREFKIKRFVD